MVLILNKVELKYKKLIPKQKIVVILLTLMYNINKSKLIKCVINLPAYLKLPLQICYFFYLILKHCLIYKYIIYIINLNYNR